MATRKGDFEILVQRAQAGSGAAAEELVRGYGRSIRRVIRHHLEQRVRDALDSSDVEQEVWLIFFKTILKGQHFDGPEHLRAFFEGLARNKVARHSPLPPSAGADVNHEQRLDDLTQGGWDVARDQPSAEEELAEEDVWEQWLKNSHRPSAPWPFLCVQASRSRR